MIDLKGRWPFNDSQQYHESTKIRDISDEHYGDNWSPKADEGLPSKQLPGASRESDERENLESVLDRIRDGELKARTPILTNVRTRNNMIWIKAEEVKLLQQFAEKMEGKKELEILKIRPVKIRVESRKPLDGAEQTEKTDSIGQINCEVVVKVFLNGTGDQTDKSVSVCVSVVNRNGDRQNVLESRKLVISVYLKDPIGNKPYRKDFKMGFSPALEEGEKGLLEFISKEKFEGYIKDGAVTFGVSIL